MTQQEVKIKREMAKNFLGQWTDAQISAQYLENAKGLERMYQKALLKPNKKHNGYTIDQLKQMVSDYYQLANYKNTTT